MSTNKLIVLSILLVLMFIILSQPPLTSQATSNKSVTFLLKKDHSVISLENKLLLDSIRSVKIRLDSTKEQSKKCLIRLKNQQESIVLQTKKIDTLISKIKEE